MEIPWIQVFLFLHIGAAIIAFGPSLAFSLIGGMGGKEPGHANFATRVSMALTRQRVLPFALTLPFSGTGLIWVAKLDIVASSSRWLLIGIAVYVFAIAYAVLVQLPAVDKVIEMTTRPPDAAGGPPAGGPPPGGPPPALAAAIRKVQQGGKIMTAAIVIIFSMMIFKPSF
jgi:hypothetical protein